MDSIRYMHICVTIKTGRRDGVKMTQRKWPQVTSSKIHFKVFNKKKSYPEELVDRSLTYLKTYLDIL